MRKTKNVMKGLTAKEEEIMGFFLGKRTLVCEGNAGIL